MSSVDRLAIGCTMVAALAWCLPRPSPRADRAKPATASGRIPLRRLAGGILTWATVSRRRAVLVAAALSAGSGALAGGVVAAIVLGTYAGLVTQGVLRARAAGLARDDRHRQLDRLGALAADLRAGARVPVALPQPPPAGGRAADAGSPAGPSRLVEPSTAADRLDELATAAVRLAERTGAPLAELLERIESDARALDRALAAAAAQAAGARATGLLLAGLPVGGLALGYAIGVDPLRVLLHTPVGAACAVGAVLLQVLGLTWTDRLGAAARRVA